MPPLNNAIACNVSLSLTGKAQIQAAAESDVVKLPKFAMVAYTGGAMHLAGQPLPVVVDLEGMEGYDKDRPALRDHNPAMVVGHTTKIGIENGALVAMGLISGTGVCADEVRATGMNGFPWQASIGAKMLAKQIVPAGESVTVNGRHLTGPLIVARRTALGEISFVALGADDDTSAHIAASAVKGPSMKFSAWLAAKGFDAATLSVPQYETLVASYKASEDHQDDGVDVAAPQKIQAKADDTDPVLQIRASTSAEMLRIAAVKRAAQSSDDICAKAISEGWTVERTELEVLRAARKPETSPASFYVNTGAGVTQAIVGEAITASACLSAGISQEVVFKGKSDQVKELATSRQMRGATLHRIIGYIAASRGIHVSPGSLSEDDIKSVLNAERNLDIKADGYTTMSLAGITENLLNKAMLAAYGQVPSVVSDIAYESDTNDFKAYKRYRLTASGAMSDVGEGGDLKQISLQDESYSNQLGTKGCLITVTRNILINDDMGALVEIPSLIGRQSAIAREKAVFTALVTNTGSFFGAGNKNYLSGAGSVLSITAVTTAVQKLMEMKDKNGDPIMVLPDRILLNPALLALGQNLFDSQAVLADMMPTTSKSQVPSNNVIRGKYRPISSPFLGAQGGCGGTDTAWYLLCNPAGGFATVQVGYLRGQRTPIIERGETPFNTLGMSMRAYYDFGVSLADFRCGILNAGT